MATKAERYWAFSIHVTILGARGTVKSFSKKADMYIKVRFSHASISESSHVSTIMMIL